MDLSAASGCQNEGLFVVEPSVTLHTRGQPTICSAPQHHEDRGQGASLSHQEMRTWPWPKTAGHQVGTWLSAQTLS